MRSVTPQGAGGATFRMGTGNNRGGGQGQRQGQREGKGRGGPEEGPSESQEVKQSRTRMSRSLEERPGSEAASAPVSQISGARELPSASAGFLGAAEAQPSAGAEGRQRQDSSVLAEGKGVTLRPSGCPETQGSP